jgi:nicotinamidase-related amidase
MNLFRILIAGAAGAALFLSRASAAPTAPTAPAAYSAEHTALLIVDPYNDFMTEGGKLYQAIKPTADASGMFDNMRKIIPAARAAGMQVFVLPHHQSSPTGDDYEGWRHVNMFQAKNQGLKAFEVGSWGARFNPEFGPKKGDIVVRQHFAQSGFANTDLDFQLKQHGISHIILVGVIANSCIESTARYGMELGYHVTLVPDAQAAFSPEGMLAAEANAPLFAHAILKTAELLKQFPVARAAGR